MDVSSEFLIPFGVVLAALVAAISALITSKRTVRTQLEIAKRASSDQLKVLEFSARQQLDLQHIKIKDERIKSEINLERQKLESLHRILSKIQLENSQTMSFMQSDNTELTTYRKRYLDNCSRLHEAQAIAALYYPEMLEKLEKIYGLANVFWGYQENLMQTDIKENKFGWESALQKVLESGNEIYNHTKTLKYQVSMRGKELTKTIMNIT